MIIHRVAGPDFPLPAARGAGVPCDMPEFLPPDAVRFELHDGAPVLRLGVDGPVQPGEWEIRNRPTLCELAAPGGGGYLLARLGADGADPAPPGWDEAVERSGGSRLCFGLRRERASRYAAVPGR